MKRIKLADYYEETKERLITECIKCGNCVTKCRVIKYAELDAEPQEIQQNIIDFLSGKAELSKAANKKGFACMRCFGCLDVKCPIGVSSTMINELVTREIELRKDNPWDMVLYPSHEQLAKQGTTDEEFKRITTSIALAGANTLFFPGCNVYKQPDKLLNALTIMDEIGKAYSFAPGMEYCCGWSGRGAAGDAEWLQKAAEKLMTFAEGLKIGTMVFWCPTCMCVLNDRIKKVYEPPFRCMTFGQYVLENIDKLNFSNAKPQKITVHEPCKTTYMKIDTEENSVRSILKAIPGTELIEMEHHGADTMCCGCDAVDTDFETGDKVTVARLEEAIVTGAEKLIDVCHNCHWIFKPAQEQHEELKGIHIENYSTYITAAMGKHREDTLERKK